MDPAQDPRRLIPAVDRLLNSAAFEDLVATTHRPLLLDILNDVIEAVRRGDARAPDADADDVASWFAAHTAERVAALHTSTLRRAINATGVVLHTNLGRAPLADAALAAVQEAAAGYSTLEYDVDTGGRGSRYDHCAPLLRRLTGAEDALVVNNTAAALVLVLNTFARGKQVVVSRGELVEIGGSFRVPDIMARSGARLVEVGATNRTHAADYVSAITPKTGMLLKVHHSNFSMSGFTAAVELDDLAATARTANVPLLYDLGSGLLDDAHAEVVPGEPTARGALQAGADIVVMSGDKLLGGPQAGIILGSSSTVAKLKKNPLTRALRVDKLTIAALEATLRLHLDPRQARREVPVLRMLSATHADLHARAMSFAAKLAAAGVAADVTDGVSAVGGGASPDRELPSALVRLLADKPSAATLARRLRSSPTPVVARIDGGHVLIDLRTVAPAEEGLLREAVTAAITPPRRTAQ
ncbi:MAG TPA: L-seryl-tRNA(Sec) selenium transferase [Longimicrobiales bacterium]